MGAAAETPQHEVRGTWQGLDLEIRVGLGGAGSGFFPGEFCGQMSLVGYSPWGYKESDMTE